MAFTLYELALQPEIQDKLRKEILDALDENDDTVTYDMVSERDTYSVKKSLLLTNETQIIIII